MQIDILPRGVCAFSEAKDHLLPCRAIQRIPQNAKSILLFLFPYLLEDRYYLNRNVSRYAVPEDYHTIANAALLEICNELKAKYPEEQFEPFCDNSPIPEVRCAARAGLGCVGENGLLIHKEYGSYVFIGEIVTTKYFEPTVREIEPCLQCGRCKKTCPTHAITETGVLKQQCLSDITQQKKPLSLEAEQRIIKSGCAWGCDHCQEVCPMNRNAKTTPIEEFRSSAIAKVELPVQLEGRAYAWRGEKVITRNLTLLSGRMK